MTADLQKEVLAMDEQAFYKVTYGLYVVSAEADGGRSGCIVNTLQQVTAEPIRLAVTISKENYTCELIEQAGRFAAVALDQRADLPLIGRHALFHSCGLCALQLPGDGNRRSGNSPDVCGGSRRG